MLLQAHSGFRYLVLLTGLIVVGYAAYGMATGRDYDKTMRVLSAAFTGVIDLTVLLGFMNLFSGTFYPALTGHIVMMVLAAAVGHIVHGVMKRRPPEQQSYAPHLIGTVVALGIISAGILAIRPSIFG